MSTTSLYLTVSQTFPRRWYRPIFHFLHNFSMDLNVFHRWFALLHLLRNTSQTQVVPGADGPEKVAKTTKQASS
jgi:hypothetical protein